MRIVIGSLIAWGILRFWYNGWIEGLYILPKYRFSYYGFEFITRLGQYTYLLFTICLLAAISFTLGLWYRLSAIVLFLSFTYIELLDKTSYLNHYYFVSLLTLLFTFLPAHHGWTLKNRDHSEYHIPRWCLLSVKILMSVVYLYAGLAKINSDWLLHAQPLRIWLPAHNDIPVIGPLFSSVFLAYAFSWGGCLYDLFIPFLLWRSKTRPFAFFLVIIFHLLTSYLFPIGMFPYIMIGAACIFFSADACKRMLKWLPGKRFDTKVRSCSPPSFFLIPVGALLLFHLLFPWRYLLYPGELFWTEEGYRFSWRVMLMEKAGYAQFQVIDEWGHKTKVNNTDFLTPLQEKMMSTQPDMILEFAHILHQHYQNQGWQNPKVFVDTYVSLNGRRGKSLIDPNVNLAAISESIKPKTWILPFDEKISGL